MTEEKSIEQLEAIEKETRQFECPCCNTQLQFRTRIHVTSVGRAATREEVAERDNRPVAIGARERKDMERVTANATVLEAAKSCGVFDAFSKALEVASMAVGGGAPTNTDAYFVQWLTKASRQRVPTFALRECLEGDAGGDLQLWGWMNVSAILQDGEFRQFIPRKLVEGEPIEQLAFEANGLTKQQAMDAKYWVRTRFGYVERSGEFTKEMRKHSIGAFSL